MSQGVLTISANVFTSTEEVFEEFKNGVEDHWERAVEGPNTNISIQIDLTRNTTFGIGADLEVRLETGAPAGGSNPPPEECGTWDVTKDPDLITVLDEGPSAVCNRLKTHAHEFGHHIFFNDAYLKPYPGMKHCDLTDLMGWGNLVKDYHARIIWNNR